MQFGIRCRTSANNARQFRISTIRDGCRVPVLRFSPIPHAMNPSQPLTAAPWLGDYVDTTRMRPATRFMLTNSDVITFHSYDDSATVEKLITALERYGRPIICSEYMARPRGSTFQAILRIFARRTSARLTGDSSRG